MAAPSQDFDFFTGNWNVRHRRLKARLANCSDWAEFDGSTTVQILLGGTGNVDDNIINVPEGAYRAVTLRSFDPRTQSWSIWWLDGRSPHTLDTPMIGTFKDGIGTFFADEMFESKPIKVRFLWSHKSTEACHWEQAFSADGGKTWETNWIMDFSKVV